MKTKLLIASIALLAILSGFVLVDQSGAQTEEYAIVRFQELGKRTIIVVYYNGKTVDHSAEFEMNKLTQGSNLDKVVPVLEELNREGFTLVNGTISQGIYQGTGGTNGITFIMKRAKG